MSLVEHLAEEALLCVVTQMVGVVESGHQLEESLQVAHYFDRLLAQQFAVDDVQLLGGIVGEPSFEVLCVLAGIEAAIAEVLH